MVEKIIVSACLLGECCRYDGKDNTNQEVISFLQGKEGIAVCPEVMGGLPIPRTPCEIIEEKVMNKNGEDKTREFVVGAQKALEIAKKNDCTRAILKSRSPSCGKDRVYDGTLCGKLVSKDGVFAKMLKENGVQIISEDEIASFLDFPFKKTL